MQEFTLGARKKLVPTRMTPLMMKTTIELLLLSGLWAAEREAVREMPGRKLDLHRKYRGASTRLKGVLNREVELLVEMLVVTQQRIVVGATPGKKALHYVPHPLHFLCPHKLNSTRTMMMKI
jgi:hypothetical protein